MKKLSLYILLFATALAWAQHGPDRALQTLLLQADQSIQTGNELLRHFRDAQAADLLRKAEQFRNEGKSAMNQDQTRIAQTSLKLALDHSRRAIDLLSKIPTSRIQEQVEELIRKAEQTVPLSGDKEADRLLARAKDNMALAQRAAHSGRYTQASEYFRVARFLAERCLSLVEGPKGNIQDKIQFERNRFYELLDRTQKTVRECRQKRATKLVEQAEVQAQNIEQAARRNEWKMAIGLYYNATRLLLRAIDICQGQEISMREQALEEIELFGQILETARERYQSSTAESGQLLLIRADQLLRQAQDAFYAEQYTIALRRTELARALISRLWNEDTFQDRTAAELERIQLEIQRLRKDERVSASARAHTFLGAAELSARDANRYLQQGRTRAALAFILAANRMVTVVNSMDQPAADLNADRIQRDLYQLGEALSSSQQKEPDQEFMRLVRQIYLRAQEQFNRQNFELAAEYISIAFSILHKNR